MDLRAYRDGANPRDAKFIELAADFAAAIHGTPKEDLLSQEVRQQRRALTLAWAAAASLFVATGAAVWQWNSALRSEHLAVAEELVPSGTSPPQSPTLDGVMVDLIGGLQEIEGMRSETARRILDRAEGAMNKLVSRTKDDPEVRRSQVTMFGLFALTYNRLGDTALALDYLRKSISLDRELPAHKQDLNNVAGGLLFLAGLLRAQGDHKGALEATRDGLDIRRALATKDPNNPGVRSELSFGLYQFGDVLRASGDLAGALDAYSEGLEIARELVAQDTTNSARNRLLGIVLDRKGVVQLARSNLPEALVAFRETLDIARQLTATDPQNMEWRHDLTASLEYVGDVLSAQGDVGGAMAAYREGLDNRRKLVTQDPSNVYWQTGVVLLLVRLAEYGDDPRSRWSEALSILAPLRAKIGSNRCSRNGSLI